MNLYGVLSMNLLGARKSSGEQFKAANPLSCLAELFSDYTEASIHKMWWYSMFLQDQIKGLVKNLPYQPSSSGWGNLGKPLPWYWTHKTKKGSTSIMVRIGQRRNGMIVTNTCIKSLFINTITQTNMILKWISGALRRNVSSGSEPPTTKFQTSLFLV